MTATSTVSFLFALVSAKDVHHRRVVDVFGDFKGTRLRDQILTTNDVVAETITLARKLGHQSAVNLGDRLYAEKLARIHWATPAEERLAFGMLKRHHDKLYSLTDA